MDSGDSFSDFGVSHDASHGVSDACTHAIQNHSHDVEVFSDTVGHFYNSHFHDDNSYSSPATFGDVVHTGLNAWGASQEMNAACGSGD